MYRAKVPAGYLHLEKTGFNWFFYDDEAFGKIVHNHRHGDTAGTPPYYKYHVLKMDFIGAQPLTVVPSVPNSTYYNYYYGKKPSGWATRVHGYYHLDLKNIWEGVDIKMYSSPAGLKYDFIIQPGSNVSTVKMKYSGQEGMMVDEGRLKIKTSVNTLVEEIPEAYQYIGDTKVQVKCRYVLKGSVLGFETGAYDTSRPLVIDPVLVFITYSGSTADNFGFTATYDSRGNLYAGGNVSEPTLVPNGKYPTTPGAFQQTFAGVASDSGPYAGFPCDIGISKYDSSGNNLLYATYIGGTDNDYPHSLIVDAQDQLVMMGSTYSDNFPILKNCYDTSKNGVSTNADIILVKLNTDGTALLGSTFIGGAEDDGVNAGPLVYNYADDFRGDVFVDIKGNILIASCSESPDFPVQNAIQGAKKAGYDGVAFSFDANLENLSWSTYLGGKGEDALFSIKIDDNDNIVVGGGTQSNDLPVSVNALHKTYLGGTSDGFIAVFDSTPNHNIKYLTYYGSDRYDQVYFIDIDRENKIYATGQTEGDIPIKNAAYGQPNRGQFIVKLRESLDSIIFATTIGNRINNPDISPTAFLVDNCDNIYISGWGSSVDLHAGSTNGLPVTAGAIQPTTDGEDFWTAVLTPGAQSLLYATFFGGTQTDDHVDGGTSRFDKRGVIYQSICGSCPGARSAANFVTDFPTTSSAAFPTNLSPRCSNTSIKLDFQITYAVDARFDVNPKLGCQPLNVQLTDLSFNAQQYKWDFGDGSPVDTNQNPNHTYTQPGKYRIKQVITNPNACNFSDSFFRTVEVIDGGEADFTFTQKECNNTEVTFENTSDGSNLGYKWRFPDGTTSTDENPKFEFTGPGTHIVTLVANPGTLCADSVTQSITLKDYRLSDWSFPNVFTPGNDSLNNCYSFEGLLVECDKVKIKIFNRWGELVYKTENTADCWNGRMLNTGDQLPEGVYYVVAKLERLDGEELEYNGTVTLFR